jgi:hypothetical protein
MSVIGSTCTALPREARRIPAFAAASDPPSSLRFGPGPEPRTRAAAAAAAAGLDR